MISLPLEAVEHHLCWTVRPVVTITVGNENHCGTRDGPHTAEANLNAAQAKQVLTEDGALVETPIAVRVLEDDNAIPQIIVEALPNLGVSIALGHPQPTTTVHRHR